MKPKISILFVVLLFCSKNVLADFPLASVSYDSCATAVTCSTSTGLYFTSLYANSSSSENIDHIVNVDSMTIRLSLGFASCNINQITSVTINSVAAEYAISQHPSYWVIRTLSIPGKYSISGWNSNFNPIGVGFTLILDAVGINEISKIGDKSVSFFPNPATNELNIISKNSQIKNIRIYTATGQEIESLNLMSSELKIPLNNYPPGIYFIHVATLNDKVLIKKITVL